MEKTKEQLEYVNNLSFRELDYYNKKYDYAFPVNDGKIIDFYKENILNENK
ncbi:MAG: hypothetical protein LBF97_06100 [Elusimicrobiota bacterium]|jgi:hypothetical protein|nr:hypothetical protein [Elusimicrobiota bacterium]